MGSFQSKKKYDVATGESTIKVRSQSSRSDRKREHLSRISQHNEALYKLNNQFEEGQNANGVDTNKDNDSGTHKVQVSLEVKDDNVSESDTKSLENVEEGGKVSAKEESGLENSTEKNSHVENENVLPNGNSCENIKKNSDVGNEGDFPTAKPFNSTNKNSDVVTEDDFPDAKSYQNTNKDSDVGNENDLPSVKPSEITNSNSDVGTKDAKSFESTKTNSDVGNEDDLHNTKSFENTKKTSDTENEDDLPSTKTSEITAPGKDVQNEESNVPSSLHTLECGTKSFEITEKDFHVHKELISNDESDLQITSEGNAKSCQNTDAHENVTFSNDENVLHSVEKVSTEVTKLPEVTESVSHTVQHLQPSSEEIVQDVPSTNEDDSDFVILSVNDKNTSINEAFLHEERNAALITDVPKHVEYDPNEHEAITVLNDAISEAADTVTVASEPSRKRVITGDAPTVEEISGVVQNEAKEEKLPPREEMHEISLVGEHIRGSIKEEKVVSHIYLESVHSDDVHYTLDKLQLMEEQIHTSRSRILSIKEID